MTTLIKFLLGLLSTFFSAIGLAHEGSDNKAMSQKPCPPNTIVMDTLLNDPTVSEIQKGELGKSSDSIQLIPYREPFGVEQP